jgi:hypothetical protein
MTPAAGSAASAHAAPFGNSADARRKRAETALRGALFTLILSVTVLQPLGLTLGSIALNSSLLAIYGLLAVALVAGRLRLAGDRLLAYFALLGLACGSAFVNGNWGAAQGLSLPSLLMLSVIYLPLAFTIDTRDAQGVDMPWLLDALADVLLLCALVGVAQFTLQFVYQAPWMFDPGALLPDILRSQTGYNTVYSMGELIKANGFFFKEPSFFSVAMAFGLLLEIAHRRRALRMVAIALALMMTYSGSGLLVLAAGLLVPLRLRTILRLLIAAVIGAVMIFALWDLLNLGFTLARVTEFTNPHTSGYHRYVAPVRLIVDSIGSQPWTFWIGHGPGSMTRLGDTSFYVFHDPTFAKAIFEYGMLGFVALLGLAALTLRAAQSPFQLRAAAFFCWVATGGYLLTPEIVYLMPLLGGLIGRAAALPSTLPGPAIAPGSARGRP